MSKFNLWSNLNLGGWFFFSEITAYKALLDESRWDTLIEQFRQENYRLFQLASHSVFTVALQAGLSALKTPYPFKQNIYFNNYSVGNTL